MTPAEYDRHKDWLQGQIAFTLDRLRSMWAIRDHVEISPDMRVSLIDLRERIEWLIDRADQHCAETASTSAELPRCARNTGGFVTQRPPSPGGASPMADGMSPTRSATP